MVLGDARQALLDVFCHCYGLLLEHLDYLSAAVCQYSGWDGYRVIRDCVNTAASSLVNAHPEIFDRQMLCEKFLDRVRDGMGSQVEPGSSGAFDICAEAIRSAPMDSPVDLNTWQRLGEGLSRDCYCRYLPASAPSLRLLVEPVDLAPSCRVSKFDAFPEKAQGWGRIVFGFAADYFTFGDYVNLPFYFFHEYLSHLHSAPMFAEHHGAPDHMFTEGWLLHYACLAYSHALFAESHHVLSHPLHRDHYMQCYLGTTIDEITHPIVYKGYEWARQFADRVGKPRFERVTLLVASTPYDVCTSARDLHGKFVRHVHDWLCRVVTLSPQERENRISVLDAVLDGPNPVEGLMEWLNC